MQLLIPAIVYFLLILLQECQSAKILFTFYHDTGSHFSSMRPMIEMLIQRGHSVSFLDTISIKNVPSGLHAIPAHILANPDDEGSMGRRVQELWEGRSTSAKLIFRYKMMDQLLGTLFLNHTDKIVEMLNEHWDLIVIDDLFWSFGFAFASLKHGQWELAGRGGNEPIVAIYSTSGQILMSAESARSVGRNWVSSAPLYPNLPTGSGDVFCPGKFTHRMFAFYENLLEHLLTKHIVPRMMPNIGKFGVPNFSRTDLYSRTSLKFSDSIDRIGWPQSIGIEMANVGAHCKQPKTLPKEFLEFVDSPDSKGTIYVAFGTYLDLSLAPGRVKHAFFGAFNRLKQYRIIFIYKGPKPANLGAHVLLTEWAPQLEILAHHRTKAFISHGGNKSIREAICPGVPVIVMPIFAEQAYNAHLLLAMGLAKAINKFTLTENGVYQTILETISSPIQAEQARKFQSMFLDRPIGAMEEGILAMERLERRGRGRAKGRWREISQRRGMHLGWAQFAHLDLLLLATTICAILSLK